MTIEKMEEIKSIESICYKKNFLKEVISRIDFVSPIKKIENDLPKEISKTALEIFPIEEPKKAIKTVNRSEFVEWNFWGKEREKVLKITPNAIVIAYYKYKNFKDLKQDFLKVTEVFFNSFKEEAQPSRLGLRYVNQIELQEGNPLNWTEYIEDEILGMLKFEIPNSKPIRIFHNMDFSFDNFNLSFKFGIYNRNYPAPIRMKEFILDYDAYFQGAIEVNDIKDNFDIYHTEIQKLFERNIKEKLKEQMR